MRIRNLVAALALSLVAAAASAADVSGNWTMAVESPMGSGSPTFTLIQKGEAVTGTYKGGLGEAPVTGTFKGSDLNLVFTVSGEGMELKITYAGKVEGNAVSGKVVYGEMGEGTFKGTKQ